MEIRQDAIVIYSSCVKCGKMQITKYLARQVRILSSTGGLFKQSTFAFYFIISKSTPSFRFLLLGIINSLPKYSAKVSSIVLLAMAPFIQAGFVGI